MNILRRVHTSSNGDLKLGFIQRWKILIDTEHNFEPKGGPYWEMGASSRWPFGTIQVPVLSLQLRNGSERGYNVC